MDQMGKEPTPLEHMLKVSLTIAIIFLLLLASAYLLIFEIADVEFAKDLRQVLSCPGICSEADFLKDTTLRFNSPLPYIAAIVDKDSIELFCTGFFVAADIVVTSALCLKGKYAKDIRVRSSSLYWSAGGHLHKVVRIQQPGELRYYSCDVKSIAQLVVTPERDYSHDFFYNVEPVTHKHDHDFIFYAFNRHPKPLFYSQYLVATTEAYANADLTIFGERNITSVLVRKSIFDPDKDLGGPVFLYDKKIMGSFLGVIKNTNNRWRNVFPAVCLGNKTGYY